MNETNIVYWLDYAFGDVTVMEGTAKAANAGFFAVPTRGHDPASLTTARGISRWVHSVYPTQAKAITAAAKECRRKAREWHTKARDLEALL